MGPTAADTDPRRTFYESATLHVRSYDSINNDERPVVRGDARLYLDLARRSGGDVLEIGVGTGHFALRLAEAGLRGVGLHASSAMLAIAAEKAEAVGLADRLHFVLGDMRAFDVGAQRFGLTIVPFRAFQVLLTPEDQLAALACFRRHLRPDGILALHLFDPDFRFLLPGEKAPVERQTGVDRQSGQRIEGVLETSSFDHVMQIRRDLWRYRAIEADGTVMEQETLELALRWTFRWEMRHLLRLAGFDVEAEFSDFAAAGPAYGKEQIWVARPGPEASRVDDSRTIL
jgi:SAM-dependent methyltransferase